MIRLMESIQDIVPFSHIRQLLVHDDNEIECEKEIDNQNIVFVELYIYYLWEMLECGLIRIEMVNIIDNFFNFEFNLIMADMIVDQYIGMV